MIKIRSIEDDVQQKPTRSCANKRPEVPPLSEVNEENIEPRSATCESIDLCPLCIDFGLETPPICQDHLTICRLVSIEDGGAAFGRVYRVWACGLAE